MIGANPKIKVTRTDVSRYLNDHSDRFPELVVVRTQYMEKCNRARRLTISQFGFWLRDNRPSIFNRIFMKLKKNPAILDELYGSTTTDA